MLCWCPVTASTNYYFCVERALLQHGQTPVDVNTRVHSLETSVDVGDLLLPRCLSFWLLAWDHATPGGF
ncbi:hypothetical protein PFLUV_G00059730 [Perca fluviatilis]|uniref:Uncharacterized protein n=1 Tax=Perca fluviatilis TaxID=8168 RepID=A0A6A5FML9_PERFL|nr:hypothetical protein PFLUV_G00059730 [Perca fluviatilis]